MESDKDGSIETRDPPKAKKCDHKLVYGRTPLPTEGIIVPDCNVCKFLLPIRLRNQRETMLAQKYTAEEIADFSQFPQQYNDYVHKKGWFGGAPGYGSEEKRIVALETMLEEGLHVPAIQKDMIRAFREGRPFIEQPMCSLPPQKESQCSRVQAEDQCTPEDNEQPRTPP